VQATCADILRDDAPSAGSLDDPPPARRTSAERYRPLMWFAILGYLIRIMVIYSP
jgi:hypothetical protein